MSTGTVAMAASAAAVVSAEEDPILLVPPTTPISNRSMSSSASSPKDVKGSNDVCAGRRVSSGGRGSGMVEEVEGVRSGGVMAGVLRPLLDALDGARGHAATGDAAMKVRRENRF